MTEPVESISSDPIDRMARRPDRLRPTDLADLGDLAGRGAGAGRAATIAMVLHRPRLALLNDLMSGDECDAVIGAASASMRRSQVIGADNAATAEHDARTSAGTYFQRGESAVVDRVQDRLMSIMGLPVAHGEPIQVLRYGPGDVYQPHFDFFEPDTRDDHRSTIARFGQRIATMICYLNDVGTGGATEFPDVGLEVRPVRASGVYFTYVDADGALDRRSLHGGAPVIEGEKWSLTQWCRSRPYRS